MNSQEQNQKASPGTTNPAAAAATKGTTDKKPVGKGDVGAPLAIKPPASPRDSQFSSVFDSCIPGGMLMFPVSRPPQRGS